MPHSGYIRAGSSGDRWQDSGIPKLLTAMPKKNDMRRPRWLKKGEEPWCMFCGASVGEISDAGEDPGTNRATDVYYCATCNYMYCSICSYKSDSCASDEAVCVRCDNIMKRVSQQDGT